MTGAQTTRDTPDDAVGGTSGSAPRMTRREFAQRLRTGAQCVGACVIAESLGAARLSALQAGQPSAASNVEMTADSYKPVRRPPKPNAVRSMDDKQVETFERTLSCPCPCTLDVYTCRTTDFTCGISPAVHRDVQALVDGGYSADEIMSALTDTYGDIILMTPRREGFNLLAWVAPFSALGLGALGIGALLRRWQHNAAASATVASGTAARTSPSAPQAMPGVDATAEELAELDAAIRDDRR